MLLLEFLALEQRGDPRVGVPHLPGCGEMTVWHGVAVDVNGIKLEVLFFHRARPFAGRVCVTLLTPRGDPPTHCNARQKIN